MLDSSKESELTPAGTFQFSHKSSIPVCLNQQDNWERMSSPHSISSCNKEDSMPPTPIKLWLPKVSLELEISKLDHMRLSLESHQSLKDNITCKSFQVVLTPRNLLSKWEKLNQAQLEDLWLWKVSSLDAVMSNHACKLLYMLVMLADLKFIKSSKQNNSPQRLSALVKNVLRIKSKVCLFFKSNKVNLCLIKILKFKSHPIKFQSVTFQDKLRLLQEVQWPDNALPETSSISQVSTCHLHILALLPWMLD